MEQLFFIIFLPVLDRKIMLGNLKLLYTIHMYLINNDRELGKPSGLHVWIIFT